MRPAADACRAMPRRATGDRPLGGLPHEVHEFTRRRERTADTEGERLLRSPAHDGRRGAGRDSLRSALAALHDSAAPAEIVDASCHLSGANTPPMAAHPRPRRDHAEEGVRLCAGLARLARGGKDEERRSRRC